MFFKLSLDELNDEEQNSRQIPGKYYTLYRYTYIDCIEVKGKGERYLVSDVDLIYIIRYNNF